MPASRSLAQMLVELLLRMSAEGAAGAHDAAAGTVHEQPGGSSPNDTFLQRGGGRGTQRSGKDQTSGSSEPPSPDRIRSHQNASDGGLSASGFRWQRQHSGHVLRAFTYPTQTS